MSQETNIKRNERGATVVMMSGLINSIIGILMTFLFFIGGSLFVGDPDLSQVPWYMLIFAPPYSLITICLSFYTFVYGLNSLKNAKNASPIEGRGSQNYSQRP